MTFLIFVETFGVLKEIPDDESEKINRDYIEKRLKKANFTPNYFSALDGITSKAKFPASITWARALVIVFLVLVGVFISSLTLDSDSTKHVIFLFVAQFKSDSLFPDSTRLFSIARFRKVTFMMELTATAS